METRTIDIDVYNSTPGVKTKLTARVLSSRFTTYYGPSGDRMRCWYKAKLVQTEDGRIWLNHPTTPAYPEEVSFDADDWFLATAFPKCCTALPEMLAEAKIHED